MVHYVFLALGLSVGERGDVKSSFIFTAVGVLGVMDGSESARFFIQKRKQNNLFLFKDRSRKRKSFLMVEQEKTKLILARITVIEILVVL